MMQRGSFRRCTSCKPNRSSQRTALVTPHVKVITPAQKVCGCSKQIGFHFFMSYTMPLQLHVINGTHAMGVLLRSLQPP